MSKIRTKEFFILSNGKTVKVGKYEYLVHLLDSINDLQYEFESVDIDDGDLLEEEIDQINSLINQLYGVSEK